METKKLDLNKLDLSYHGMISDPVTDMVYSDISNEENREWIANNLESWLEEAGEDEAKQIFVVAEKIRNEYLHNLKDEAYKGIIRDLISWVIDVQVNLFEISKHIVKQYNAALTAEKLPAA